MLICVARSLSACMVVSSTALARHRNLPVICWRWSFCFGDSGAELSISVSWIFAPQFGGVKGDGECCGFVGFGCWNCERARSMQFFMLVLSVLLVWFQSRSMPTHPEPDQSVLMGQWCMSEATRCSASSLFSQHTPKSSTTNVNDMGRVSWRNRPGV